MEAGLWVLALGFMGCGDEVPPETMDSGAVMVDAGVACVADERVSDNTCAPCPAGTSNEAGDDAVGADTVCDAVSCPENSTGTDVATGCSCDAGYAGEVSASREGPYYTGICANVNECEAASTCGASSGAGSCADTEGGYTCTCSAGYAPIGMGLSASCEAVACPAGSTGSDVPSGCSCEIDGSIDASSSEPYFEGECAAVTAVSAGGYSSCVLLSTGGVQCWGNIVGVRSDGMPWGPFSSTTTPFDLYLGEGVMATALSAGDGHTCALLSTGAVQCWGENDFGQLGDGSTSLFDAHGSVAFEAGVMATGVSASREHTCALVSTGGVQCWGRNNSGKLGDGTAADRSTPVAVSLGAGVTVTVVSAGREHTCALLSTGGVQCWGSNYYGQLGDGTETDSSTPVDVPFEAGVTATAVSAGEYHTCALLSTGRVHCWGDNRSGQLGDGSTTERSTPMSVAFEAGVTATAVSAGEEHTCALLSTGGVQCWGKNRYGRLGDGTTADRRTPVAVSLGAGVMATGVSASREHTCALLSMGGVQCWGGNRIFGQLGDGTETDSSTPVNVVWSGPEE